MSHRPRLLILAALMSATSPALALPSSGQERTPTVAPRSGGDSPLPFLANSHLLGGSPVSIGLDWMATYDEGGMTFVPALGERAPATRLLHFRLTGVAVGGRALAGLDLDAQPTLVGKTVTYARGAGLTELYDARQEGLEQSFELHTLPAREGDLVVRGALSTDLEPAGLDPDGSSLRFREPGHAEVRIDKVVAIDADGERMTGTLRYDGGTLEIVVPASFVATASLPLLIDPLFGPIHDADGFDGNGSQADIAFGEPINDEYAITFRKSFSAVTSIIAAGTFKNDGAPGLPLFALSSIGLILDREPAIAYNRPQTQFVVAWERTPALGGAVDVVLTTFDANSGIVESAINVATGLSTPRLPDVGGEAVDGPFNRVVVVYAAAGTIRVASVDVTDGATPMVVSDQAIPSMVGSHARPAITKSGGVAGRYFVAADKGVDGSHDIGVAVVSYTGAVLPGSATVSSVLDDSSPDIAGDSASCLVVYQRGTTPTALNGDIIAQKLTYDGSSLTVDPDSIGVALGSTDQREPAIGRSGNEYLVAWAERVPSTPGLFLYQIGVRTIGADTCLPCEPAQSLGVSISSMRQPEIGTRAAGGAAGAEEAAVAFHFELSGSFGAAFRMWQNDGGGTFETNAGGGCGNAGTFAFSGSRSIGSDDLLAKLGGADPLATVAILNVNVPGGDIPCGACSILQPFLLFSVPTTPGAFGTKDAQVPLAIPCDVRLAGATLAFQWWVLPTSVSPCVSFPTISASDQIWLTLGF